MPRLLKSRSVPQMIAVKLMPYDPDIYIRVSNIESITRQGSLGIMLGYVGNPIRYRDLGQMEDEVRAMLEREPWYCVCVRQGRERHNYLMSGANRDKLIEDGVIIGA